MVGDDEINTNAALVLMLTSQAEILERMSDQESRIENLERWVERYPSVTWLWKYERRSVVVILIMMALLYTFIFSPWLISDIRHKVLQMVGLPPDLGLGVTP